MSTCFSRSVQIRSGQTCIYLLFFVKIKHGLRSNVIYVCAQVFWRHVTISLNGQTVPNRFLLRAAFSACSSGKERARAIYRRRLITVITYDFVRPLTAFFSVPFFLGISRSWGIPGVRGFGAAWPTRWCWSGCCRSAPRCRWCGTSTSSPCTSEASRFTRLASRNGRRPSLKRPTPSSWPFSSSWYPSPRYPWSISRFPRTWPCTSNIRPNLPKRSTTDEVSE